MNSNFHCENVNEISSSTSARIPILIGNSDLLFKKLNVKNESSDDQVLYFNEGVSVLILCGKSIKIQFSVLSFIESFFPCKFGEDGRIEWLPSQTNLIEIGQFNVQKKLETNEFERFQSYLKNKK